MTLSNDSLVLPENFEIRECSAESGEESLKASCSRTRPKWVQLIRSPLVVFGHRLADGVERDGSIVVVDLVILELY